MFTARRKTSTPSSLRKRSYALRKARQNDPELEPGGELPRTVVIRADKATPFGLLNHVIRVCQSQGFRKFQYRAMSGGET